MMVINARPRYVSHGFESFVPSQRVESLHQRLVEMTNNDVNAWNFYRPAPSPGYGWEENLDGLNNENFTFHNSNSGYYQNTASIPQPQVINLQKAPLYPVGYQTHSNNYSSTASNIYSMHQEQSTAMSCIEKRNPMLANGYSHSYLGQRHGSFAEFSNTRNGMKQFACENLNEPDLAPFIAAPPSSCQETVPIMSDFDVSTANPNTTFSSYSSSSAAVDPLSLLEGNIPSHQNASMRDMWWPENPKRVHGQNQDSYDLEMLHDGLPTAHNQQEQQFVDAWAAGNDSSIGWSAHVATPLLTAVTAPNTISPKALTLGVPAPSISSSESSQSLNLPLSELSSASSSRHETPESIPETLQVVEPAPVRPHRQILLDSLVQMHASPTLQSNEYSCGKSTGKLFLKSNSVKHSVRKPTPPTRSKLRLLFTSPKKDSTSARTVQKIEPKPTATSASASPTAKAAHHRNEKDDFLVKHKLAGMSYKDVRRLGNFTEAESTLRGRFRTLTKHKTARVRKPEWTDNDVRLLKKAVRKLTKGSDIAKGKVPWKSVAEYIANNGGSYHFGNATCRKRWDELPTKQRA